MHLLAGEHRVVRLGCFQRALLQQAHDGAGHLDAVALQDGHRVGAGGGVGHGGAAGDDRGVVARHVADGQRDHPGGAARRRQPPALDAREVLAHAVHLADAGAAFEQGAVDALGRSGQYVSGRGADEDQADGIGAGLGGGEGEFLGGDAADLDAGAGGLEHQPASASS